MRKRLMQMALILLCAILMSPVGAVAKEKGWFFGGDKAKPGDGDLGSYNAILIGINRYDSFPSLSTPVADVEALAEVLRKDYGFDEVTLLTDRTSDKPTNSNIQKLIREKARSLGARDNLLIYYAGHGHLDVEATGDGYWIPVDGRSDDPSTWIPHEQITKIMGNDKIKVKSFILIADSCYSGSMMRSIRIEPPPSRADDDTLLKRMMEGAEKRSRIIVSSGANEPVPDRALGTKHSLFAHYFLKGLKENKERYLDMGLLFNSQVKPEVEKRIKTKPQISRLTSAVDEDGIFVLTKAGVAPPPKKADQKAENEQLLKEKAALEAKLKAQQVEFESKMAALAARESSLSDDLKKLRDIDKSNKDQIEALLKKQKAEKKQYEAQLTELKEKQNTLNDDLQRLDEIDKKNKADELKLQAALREKDLLSAGKMAEVEKEKQRIAELNRQIEAQRKSLAGKEQALAGVEAQLKKSEAKMSAQLKEEEKKIAQLRAKEREIEEKALQAELTRKKISDETRQAELNKKKIEEETRLAEQKKKELDEAIRKAQEEMAGIYSGTKEGDAAGRFVVLGNIVFDKNTNLMWLKDANYANIGKDFDSAESYVANLSVDGYANWQLPTKEEWRSLVPENVKGINSSLPTNPFKNIVVSGQYWVSSLMGSQGINLGHGSIGRLNKKNPAYVWPVRYATPEEIRKFRSR